MNWHLGQKIVCVRSNWLGRERLFAYWPQRPVEGETYTIRAIGEMDGKVGFLLEELWNTEAPAMAALYNWPFIERGFEADSRTTVFRPLVVRKTDISVFERLLLPGGKQREPV